MTYPVLALSLLALAAIVTATTARLPRFGARLRSSAIAAAVLVALTALFDNIMIGLGLFHYPEEHLSGVRIGLAPLEDFSYPLVAAFLVPAVWTLAGAWMGRKGTASAEELS